MEAHVAKGTVRFVLSLSLSLSLYFSFKTIDLIPSRFWCSNVSDGEQKRLASISERECVGRSPLCDHGRICTTIMHMERCIHQSRKGNGNVRVVQNKSIR